MTDKPTSSQHAAIPPIPRVNLLPQSVRIRLVSRRRTRAWTILVLAVALIGVGVWEWTRLQTANIRTTRARLDEVKDRLQIERDTSLQLARRAAQLQERQQSLTAMCASESWSRRLAELAALVPQEVVLTRIEIMPPGKFQRSPQAAARRQKKQNIQPNPTNPATPGVELHIEGLAAEHITLADFLRRLDESGRYRDVRLVRSNSEAGSHGAWLSFGVACRR